MQELTLLLKADYPIKNKYIIFLNHCGINLISGNNPFDLGLIHSKIMSGNNTLGSLLMLVAKGLSSADTFLWGSTFQL